jgi:hypothetical protein
MQINWADSTDFQHQDLELLPGKSKWLLMLEDWAHFKIQKRAPGVCYKPLDPIYSRNIHSRNSRAKPFRLMLAGTNGDVFVLRK